jgi:hypothetical protein
MERKCPDFALCIAGQEQATGYRALLVEAAERLGIAARVRIFEPPAESLPELYAAADVFVSPSDNVQETFGLTLLEAMASGLPVVASAWDGYKDIVEDGRTGFLIPSSGPVPDRIRTAAELFLGSPETLHHVAQTTAVDVEVLTDRLETLIRQRRLRRMFGNNARRSVERSFTWMHVVHRLESVWTAALRRRVRGGVREQQMSDTGIYSVDYSDCFGDFASSALPKRIILSPSGAAVVNENSAIAGLLARLASSAGLDFASLLDSLSSLGTRPSTIRRWTPELAFALKHGLIANARAHRRAE